MPRYALHGSGETRSLVAEGRFGSELDLHDAIFEYPKLIPHDAFGLGPLVVLAKEFACARGRIDLLLVDESGQLVICEVKKGSENSDVRKVVAQMLDYGASLWRTSMTDFDQKVASCEPNSGEVVIGKVTKALGTVTQPEAFRMRVEKCLEDGDFVFLYVVRDLDDDTARVIDFLTAHPRLRMFAMEVDYFNTDTASVMVPRASAVPAWATEPSSGESGYVNPDADRLIDQMNGLASELDLRTAHAQTGRRYYSQLGDAYVGVYRSSRGAEFGLADIAAHDSDLANSVRRAMRDDGLTVSDDVQWPSYACSTILENWEALSTHALPMFYQGTSQAVGS